MQYFVYSQCCSCPGAGLMQLTCHVSRPDTRVTQGNVQWCHTRLPSRIWRWRKVSKMMINMI